MIPLILFRRSAAGDVAPAATASGEPPCQETSTEPRAAPEDPPTTVAEKPAEPEASTAQVEPPRTDSSLARERASVETAPGGNESAAPAATGTPETVGAEAMQAAETSSLPAAEVGTEEAPQELALGVIGGQRNAGESFRMGFTEMDADGQPRNLGYDSSMDEQNLRLLQGDALTLQGRLKVSR